jgi:hypothetical protein
VTAFTLVFTRLFDLLVAPFGSHRVAGLIALSLLMGAGLTFLYRATADAPRIRRTRDLFKARVLEMRIYPDDFVLITRALGGALAAQGAYLRAAARPILIVAVVAIPVYFQIESRYAHAPLIPGASTIITARLKPGLDVRSVPTSLANHEQVRVDPRSVRSPSSREVAWRVEVLATGRRDTVHLTAFDNTYKFALATRPDNRAIGNERQAHSAMGAITDIGLPSIPNDSALDRVTVEYPDARYHVLGMSLSWITVFLAATLAGALVPAVLLKVAL